MPTTVKLKKLLHRKSMEMCTPALTASVAGAFVTGDESGLMPQRDCFYYVTGATGIYNYSAEEDAWMQLPNSGIAGTFGAGACGDFRSLGAMGGVHDQTATAGTTSTLTTNKTIVRNLVGCKVRVVSGTGVGYEGTVASNTIGANSVLTVTPANGVAFDATTVFRVWSGSLWFFCPGAGTVGFSVYDRATNVWTARGVTNVATTFGTTGQLVSTESNGFAVETGTSTGTNTTTTLNDTGKAWQVNALSNYQVRITAGTGIGQTRSIASNTATALTVSAAWTVTPDATSVYSVEGNDDYIYLLGNAAGALYRFSVSNNAWTVLAPAVTRGGGPGGGATADWVNGVTDSDWAGAAGKAHLVAGTYKQNGRYIYSFRGAGASTLDIYDIAANTWINGVSYGNQQETLTTGSSSSDYAGMIYISKEATGRIYRFDVAKNALEPFTTNLHPQGTAVEGDKLFFALYKDGATVLPFLYAFQHSRAELLRTMVF